MVNSNKCFVIIACLERIRSYKELRLPMKKPATLFNLIERPWKPMALFNLLESSLREGLSLWFGNLKRDKEHHRKNADDITCDTTSII